MIIWCPSLSIYDMGIKIEPSYSTVELALLVWVRESQPHGIEGRPADPELLRDLDYTGQQQDNQEACWGSRIDGVAEARDLKPDQWLIATSKDASEDGVDSG